MGDGDARERIPPRHRLTQTSRERQAGPRGGCQADTAFTAENKLRILQLADACTTGALLRTEGLYASNLMTWRRQRTVGVRSTLTPQKRGRKASAQHPLRAENETLRTVNARLTMRLKQAELIIDEQKQFHRSWAFR